MPRFNGSRSRLAGVARTGQGSRGALDARRSLERSCASIYGGMGRTARVIRYVVDTATGELRTCALDADGKAGAMRKLGTTVPINFDHPANDRSNTILLQSTSRKARAKRTHAKDERNSCPSGNDLGSRESDANEIELLVGRSVMHRRLLGCCAILLFAAFGMLSGVALAAHHDEPNAPSESITFQGEGLRRQEMSEEEKERWREECAREYEFCFDWCGRSNPRDTAARAKCRQDCSDKNAACMKKIESNPIQEPDY